MPAAGKMDRRITIQRVSVTQDEYNNDVEAWEDVCTVWASYEPLSDGERLRAGERAAEASARFQIRHSLQVADVSARDRLIFGGAVYQVTHVKEVGRRKGLELTVVSRADG
jgi:SPP1 family predicted phage head-tail adaptor